ncbi:MAG: hypothetical protein C3F15_00645 [Holophagae bacterium]|nr:MAG: hypothetical protein C3F15_00645 [Holophagae bacterium]
MTFADEWHDRENLHRQLRTVYFRMILVVGDIAAAAPLVEIDEIVTRRGFELVEKSLGPGRPNGAAEGAT